jgi:hypothetical protein
MRPFPVPKIDSKEEFQDIGFIDIGKLQQMCQHFGIVGDHFFHFTLAIRSVGSNPLVYRC